MDKIFHPMAPLANLRLRTILSKQARSVQPRQHGRQLRICASLHHDRNANQQNHSNADPNNPRLSLRPPRIPYRLEHDHEHRGERNDIGEKVCDHPRQCLACFWISVCTFSVCTFSDCTWCKDWTLTGPEGSPTLGDVPCSYGPMTAIATWASSPFQGIPEGLTDLG